MKLRRVYDASGGPVGWCHWCPGCRQVHSFNVEQPTRAWPEFNIAGGVAWKFDGNRNMPTFTPSMHILSGGFKRGDVEVPQCTLCHYNLTEGKIQFHGDSAHELKGQLVPLPHIPRGH